MQTAAKTCETRLKVWMQTCEGRLKVCAQTCEAGLKGENLRGGVESLQANLRPWTRTQAFAGKWRCKFTLKLARGVESLPTNMRGEVESLPANLRGEVESLRANLRGGVESLRVQTFVES